MRRPAVISAVINGEREAYGKLRQDYAADLGGITTFDHSALGQSYYKFPALQAPDPAGTASLFALSGRMYGALGRTWPTGN